MKLIYAAVAGALFGTAIGFLLVAFVRGWI